MIPKAIKQNWIMAKVTQNIKEYEITGTVVDNGWLYANRETLESYLRDDMRFNNILPILDMPTEIACSYNQELSIFEFSMKAPGYYMEYAGDYLGILVKDGVIISSDSKRVMLCEEF